ncbi:acyltransferase family protein [Acinetobacter sp. YH12105]|uniref:acyltransferase family protein n=1 Tax=Acinetobacter sp. YH12105 TaxID=2601093 RepID=UPI0015D0E7EC|nr:acyltransferase family protein [Acinetobacter sp. YH12105]
MNIKYRTEIDGLRAIAVLLVVLNHLGATLFKGGFVGVDVFFVISGFLITSIIKTEIENNDFTFTNFYKKRILRLAPAYFLVLSTTTLAMFLLAAPQQLVMYIKSVVYSSFFAANFFMWSELGGYFSANAEFTPLLHLWSLGVEEQFYILFPVVLILLTKYFPKFRVFLIILALLFGLLLSQYMSINNASAAYFLLPFRAFELLLGVLLAFIPVRYFKENISNMVTALGLALILIPAFTFNEKTIFPGLNALYPCLGTALIIYFARAGISQKILSSSPMVFFGKISYPLYLWHWPLIVFLNFYFIEINILVGSATFLTTVLLSWLTYQYVEKYFSKFKNSKPRLIISKGYLLPIFGVVVLSTLTFQTQGFSKRFNDSVIDRETALYSKTHVIRSQCINGSSDKLPNSDKCKLGTDKNEVDLLLIGDSHANHFAPMIDVFAKDMNLRGYDIAKDSTIFLPNIDRYKNEKDNVVLVRDFKVRNDELIKLIKNNNFKYIVLAGSYANSYEDSIFKSHENQKSSDVFLKGLDDAITLIESKKAIPIIIKGSPKLTNYDQTCSLRKEMYKSQIDCDISIEQYKKHFKKWDKDLNILKSKHPNLVIIDPAKVMCNATICNSELGGIPLYVDKGHLNYEGSTLVGKKYLQEFGNPLKN